MGTIRDRLEELFKRTGFRRHVANLSWIFGARVFTMGVSFIAIIVVARALGPSNFGELDYALAVVGIGAVFANFGLTELLYRELIKFPEKRGELLGTALGLRLCTGLLTALAIVGFAFLSPIDTVSRVLLIILAGMLPLDTLALFSQVFMAEARSKIPSLITMGGWSIAAGAKILFVLLGQGAIWIAATYILEHALYGVALYLYYQHTRGRVTRLSFAPELIPPFLATGVTLLLSGAFAMLFIRIDQILIRHFLGPESVGFYSAAVRIIEIVNIIPSVLIIGLYPAILGIRRASEQSYAQRIRTQTLLLFLTGIILMFAFVFLAGPLISLIFGQAFLSSIDVFRIYAFAIPAMFMMARINDILYTDNLRRGLITTTGMTAAINIGLNVLWIPTYGITGAAWATVTSFYIACLLPFLMPLPRRSLLNLVRPGR